MLVEGDEVTVACQICGARISPIANYGARVCGRECNDELHWREALATSGGRDARYAISPKLKAWAEKVLAVGDDCGRKGADDV